MAKAAKTSTAALLFGLVFLLGGALDAGAQCTLTLETPVPGCMNACTNGFDDDGDGLTDAADPSCTVETPRAGLLNACTNGLDDDEDGYVDGADDSCKVETRWPMYNACTDTIDNDGDGWLDSAAYNPANPLIVGDPECLGEVYCSDGWDNDGDGLVDVNDPDCQCMEAAGANSCSANDFNIAYNVGNPTVFDGCVNTTDTVVVTGLTASISAANAVRPDLGLWVALDGTDAFAGGRCMRQILTPVVTSGWPASPIPAGGPYPVLEAATDEKDTCGDLGNLIAASYEFPMPVELRCLDNAIPSGYIDLGQCGSWKVNDKAICSSVSQATPSSGPKCQCDTKESSIPGPNVTTACSTFTTPTWVSGAGTSLDPGETVRFQLSFSNTVTGACVPATLPIGGDPFGRTRCGTVSFMRFVVNYNNGGVDADAYGDFFLDGTTDPVPLCTGTPADIVQGVGGSGVLCNDTTAKRLVWAPADPVGGFYGVVSPLASPITLPFHYRLNAQPDVGTTQVTMNARIYWDSDLDTDNSDTISKEEAVAFTSKSKLQTCTNCDCTTNFTTTPVTLGAFAARREGHRVVFDWASVTEVGNAGFNLLGRTADGWVRLNRELIPADAGDALQPQRYSQVLDVPAGVSEFAIEDVDVTGRATLREAADLAAMDDDVLAVEPVKLRDIRSEQLAAKALRDERRRADVARELAALPTSGFGVSATRIGSSLRASSPVIELTVTRDGLYRVTYEDLLAAGFDLGKVQVGKLGLSNRGTAVPIRVVGGKTFGPGAYFEFYGRALDTLYTSSNVYRLFVDALKPARVAVDAAAPAGAAAAFYGERRDFERNLAYTFGSPMGDPWYDTRMQTGMSANQWQFPFTVDGLVDGAATARLSVRMYGGTDPRQSPDHHVLVILNGVTVGDYLFDGLADMPVAIDLPAGALHDGTNTLTLRLPGDTGATFDIVNLESFAVSYPRTVTAIAGALTLTGSAARYDVAGLPSDTVVAYRVSGGAVAHLAGTTVAAAGGGYTASLRGDGGGATYVVASESALLKPAIAAARSGAGITAGSAQYLVITHPSFADGLAPLVAARQAQGLQVRVVDVEDVYSQYSGGILDPAAIRDYIAHARANLGTEFVLLVGGDSYDYHDYLGKGSISFIPSLYVATGDIVRFAPADAAYADVDRDGVPDVAIGRLPVRTRAELDLLVAKTLAYEARDYDTSAVFAADGSDSAANVPFAQASNSFIAHFPGTWQTQRVYLDQLAVADARAALIGALNGGVALANYVGHSGATAWTFKNLFNVTDAGALTNAGRPAVVTQWGCWNTYYVNPTSESLATRLLLAGDKGAAAVLGATTLTEDTHENALGAQLWPRIAVPGTTLGEAIVAAKRALVGDPAEHADVLLGWSLLGDPALVIQR